MFIFERQVSRRILEHQRHLLPHESGIPLRILLLNQTPSQLRCIVLGMVKRGDFDAAVRELVDMMAGIAMETRLIGYKTLAENYYGTEGLPCSSKSSEEESDDDESDDSSLSDNDQEFENRYGTEWLQWTPDWPSNSWLSKKMRWHRRATGIINGPPMDTQKDRSRGLESMLLLLDALLAAYTQNLVDQKLLTEKDTPQDAPCIDPLWCIKYWHGTARAPPLNAETARRILVFVEALLPRRNDFHAFSSVVDLTNESQFIDMLFSCAQYVFMSNPGVFEKRLVQHLTDWNSLSRLELLSLAFPGPDQLEVRLKVLKSVIHKIDADEKKILLLHTWTSLLRKIAGTPSCEWAASPGVDSAANELISAIERPKALNPFRSFRSPEALVIGILCVSRQAAGLPQKSDGQFNRVWDKALTLASGKSNMSDKRTKAAQAAAVDFLARMAFMLWLAQQNTNSAVFRDLAEQVSKYAHCIADEFDTLSSTVKIEFALFCSKFNPEIFTLLTPKLFECRQFLQFLRGLRSFGGPKTFLNIFDQCKCMFYKMFVSALNKNNTSITYYSLDLILSAPKGLSKDVVKHVFECLTQHLVNCKTIDSSSRELYEFYVVKLVHRWPELPSQTPIIGLIPDDDYRFWLTNPERLQSLYQLLRLLAGGGRVLPKSICEQMNCSSLRAMLLLCLCLDRLSGVELALSCMELLQSSPHQTAAERDVVSGLLDGPEVSIMSQEYADTLRRRLGQMLVKKSPQLKLFCSYLQDALNSSDSTPWLKMNLLRLKISTLGCESEKKRKEFYANVMALDGRIMRRISGFVVLDSKISFEFLRYISENLSSFDERKLRGVVSLCVWLFECTGPAASVLNVSHICRHIIKLQPLVFRSRLDRAVLKLIEAASVAATPQQFEPVILELLDRRQTIMHSSEVGKLGLMLEKLQMTNSHSASSRSDTPLEPKETPTPNDSNHLGSTINSFNETEVALCKTLNRIFHNFQTDSCLAIITRLSDEFDFHDIRPALATLLFANLNVALQICGVQSNVVTSWKTKTAAFDALTWHFSTRAAKVGTILESSDFLKFLLQHPALLTSLCDVCSVEGNDVLSTTLLTLFMGHDSHAELTFIEIILRHEVEICQAPTNLFRSNSVTMQILLGWVRNCSTKIIHDTTEPAIAILRGACVDDDADYDSILKEATDSLKPFRLYPWLQWFYDLMAELVEGKFGKEYVDYTMGTFIVLRIACPCVTVPHLYGVSERPPSRVFAAVLRKFSVYLHRNQSYVLNFILHVNPDDDEEEVKHWDLSPFSKPVTVKAPEVYTSATRQVFHFLHQHAVEVRIVLLAQNKNETVSEMLRLFRLGRPGVGRNKLHESYLSRVNTILLDGKPAVAVCVGELCTQPLDIEKICFELDEAPDLRIVADFSPYYKYADAWVEFNGEPLSMLLSHLAGARIVVLNAPKEVYLRVTTGPFSHYNFEFITTKDMHRLQPLSALPYLNPVFEDFKEAVPFANEDCELFVGPSNLHIIQGVCCDILPLAMGPPRRPLVVNVVENNAELYLSDYSFQIRNAPSPFIRILQMSISNIMGDASLIAKTPSCVIPVKSSKEKSGNNYYWLKPAIIALSPLNTSEEFCSSVVGQLLFTTLTDMASDVPEMRRYASELYAVFPDSLGLNLSVLTPQQSLSSSQIVELASEAAEAYPDLAKHVICGLINLKEKISRRAVRVAAPWISYLIEQSDDEYIEKNLFAPLIDIAIHCPSSVAVALAEYFWPFIHSKHKLLANMLVDAGVVCEPMEPVQRSELLDRLCQIVATCVSPGQPIECRDMVNTFVGRFYCSLKATEDDSIDTWSDHPSWLEAETSAALFGSVAVDSDSAEHFFADMSFVVLVLCGVGPERLRRAIHELLTNYLNAYLLALRPQISAEDCVDGSESMDHLNLSRRALRAVRAKVLGTRGHILFNVHRDAGDWTYDVCGESPADLSEKLCIMLSEMSVAVFGGKQSRFKKMRFSLASKLIEYSSSSWPTLQRRCILGILGTTRFLMSGEVVTRLLELMVRALSANDRDDSAFLWTRKGLCNAYLRMFSNAVECIPESSGYHHRLFWLACATLATRSSPVTLEAMRLLKQTVKISHLRGAFKRVSVAEFFLNDRPEWLSELEPFLRADLPSTVENFHLAVSLLLVPAFQNGEFREISLETLEVMVVSCPSEVVYSSITLIHGDVDSKTNSQDLVSTNSAQLTALASRSKHTDEAVLISLAILCTITSKGSETPNFAISTSRLFDFMLMIKDRKTVTTVSPLLRPSFVEFLALHDRRFEGKATAWSLAIFTDSPAERKSVIVEVKKLHESVKKFGLSPWFDEEMNIIPFDLEVHFSHRTCRLLASHEWALSESDEISEDKMF